MNDVRRRKKCAQSSTRDCKNNGSLCTHDIYLSSFWEMARSWYEGRIDTRGGGNLWSEKDKVQYLLAYAGYTGTLISPSSLKVVVLLGNRILSLLRVSWTVCVVECLHDLRRLYLKWIVLVFRTFLSGYSVPRGLGGSWTCYSGFPHFFFLFLF